MASLYSDKLMDHAKAPRHYGVLSRYHVRFQTQNPLCGDELTLYLRCEDEQHYHTSFEGRCCTVCRSSASIMMTQIHDQSMATITGTLALAFALSQTKSRAETPETGSLLDPGDLHILWQSLKDYPVRHKCAIFPWQSLEGALAELKGAF